MTITATAENGGYGTFKVILTWPGVTSLSSPYFTALSGCYYCENLADADNGTNISNSSEQHELTAENETTIVQNTSPQDAFVFGVEQNPSANNTNPFRFASEYFDLSTGTYYLRARHYNPTTGRFTQPDPHWSLANMIFGDDPRRINERTDPLGLHTYTMVPDIWAIMQSGNLYMYVMHNPVFFTDSSGLFAVPPQALKLLDKLAAKAEPYVRKAGDWLVSQGQKAVEAVRSFFTSGRGAQATQQAAQQGSRFGNATLNQGSNMREKLLNTVQNDRLINAINELYRPGATFGDGGVAAAVRHEIATGLLVNGVSHIQKATERITNLTNIIRNQNLSANDLAIANQLLRDLRNALGGG